MKFTKIVGKFDPKIIEEAQKKLSLVFLELGTSPTSNIITKLGGNPFLFTLLQPMQHIATQNIPTAATNGKVYYWNPEFVASLDLIGLRFFCEHEPWHPLYLHIQRKGVKNNRLWNIATDFIVWHNVFDGLKKRGKDPVQLFNKYVGQFITLEQTIHHFKNPSDPLPGFEDIEKIIISEVMEKYPDIEDATELTREQRMDLYKINNKANYFYIDPNLPDDMLKPEKIYEQLYQAIPKCKKCGRLGVYPNPNNKKPHTHHICICDECCGDYDLLGEGGTVDEHLDIKETQEQTYKRFSDAVRMASSMGAGATPGYLEDELGILSKPKVRWQDFVRSQKAKIRAGNSKNDYSRMRSRPLMAGMLLPKKINRSVNFGCLLDTSGSMSTEDMSFGVSQLMSLDDRAEGWLCFADSVIYWDKIVKLRKINQTELQKLKPVGRGGTLFSSFLSEYEKKVGSVDFLIMITDGYLLEDDIKNMKSPKCPVYWIITSECNFKAPFGKVFKLRN